MSAHMDPSVETRITSYVQGFFPPSYQVAATVYVLEGARAPLVCISVVAPNGSSAYHDAYQHQILDICYMEKAADYLRQVVSMGLIPSRPLISDRCRDSQGKRQTQNPQPAQQRRAAERPAGLRKKGHI